MSAARVASLALYPVKSLVGERRAFLDLDERGVVGDRLWSVRTATGRIGSGKTTRRFDALPGLLRLRASVDGDSVVITLPDGTWCAAGTAEAAECLTRFLGQPVTVERETGVSHFDDGPVSLLGTASVAAASAEYGGEVDPSRFRANVVLATEQAFEEDQWVGSRVQVGTAVLRVELASPRCVMVNAETADLPGAPGVLTAVGRANQAQLGVVASVVTPGRIRVGDPLRLREPS